MIASWYRSMIALLTEGEKTGLKAATPSWFIQNDKMVSFYKGDYLKEKYTQIFFSYTSLRVPGDHFLMYSCYPFWTDRSPAWGRITTTPSGPNSWMTTNSDVRLHLDNLPNSHTQMWCSHAEKQPVHCTARMNRTVIAAWNNWPIVRGPALIKRTCHLQIYLS